MLVLVSSQQLINHSGANYYPFGGVADAIGRISGVVLFLSLFLLLLPTGLLSLHSLFPSIYDIDGCATTAVYLVSGWVFTLRPRAGF